MGMAASQARYLGLTARKTNVEYEGQQVNQARTALANQSANTFNDLLALEVPTAPSTQDFTTTQYSYEDGTVGETITSMTPLENDPDGYNYLINHYHFADVFTGIENKKRNPQIYVNNMVNEDEVEYNKITTTTDPVTGAASYSVNGRLCSTYDATDVEQKAAYDQLTNTLDVLKEADPTQLLTYVDGSGIVHFIKNDEMKAASEGTANAADYSLKGGKPHTSAVEANKITSTLDAVTGETTYSVKGNVCAKYDPANEEMKAAYDSAVLQNAALGKVNVNDLYTYQDAEDGIHFISQADLNTVIAGQGSAADYSVYDGVPIILGTTELSIYDPTDKTQLAAYEQIVKDWPDSIFAGSTSTIYTWEQSGQRYFACAEDLMASWKSAPDSSKPTENQNSLAYYSAQNISTKIENTERAIVNFDEKGRAESIRFEDSSVVRVLKTETITDEAAYNDAMNQYNYNQAVYEKKLADINAKTKEIQEQDRTLELRLRQLDTEQEALQTEMEAVKKVIEKNIESTFKTFE